MARNARLRSQAAAIFRLEQTPTAVGVDQERDHHGDVERRLAAELAGVMLVEGREVELRDEIEQEEHQVVFGQRVARRDRLLAALLGVPGAVVLASIVHDLAPALCIKPLGSCGTIHCSRAS